MGRPSSDLKRQIGVAEAAPQQVRTPGPASALGMNLVAGVRREVRDTGGLEVAPGQLHRVMIGHY